MKKVCKNIFVETQVIISLWKNRNKSSRIPLKLFSYNADCENTRFCNNFPSLFRDFR